MALLKPETTMTHASTCFSYIAPPGGPMSQTSQRLRDRVLEARRFYPLSLLGDGGVGPALRLPAFRARGGITAFKCLGGVLIGYQLLPFEQRLRLHRQPGQLDCPGSRPLRPALIYLRSFRLGAFGWLVLYRLMQRTWAHPLCAHGSRDPLLAPRPWKRWLERMRARTARRLQVRLCLPGADGEPDLPTAAAAELAGDGPARTVRRCVPMFLGAGAPCAAKTCRPLVDAICGLQHPQVHWDRAACTVRRGRSLAGPAGRSGCGGLFRGDTRPIDGLLHNEFLL